VSNLQAGGRRFDPGWLHSKEPCKSVSCCQSGNSCTLALRAHARQIAVRHGDLRLVIIDYPQLMHINNPTGNRTTDVSQLSRGLNILAR
jgi:replicative DNA helicase